MSSSPGADDRFIGLKQKIVGRMKSAQVQNQIKALVMQAYENALAQENAVLSRPERQRLFVEITQQVLNDMLDESYGYTPSQS